MCERGGNCGQMWHSNSFFRLLYSPFQSYFLLVNEILLVGVGRAAQFCWVIARNFLSTSDLHLIFFPLILCYLTPLLLSPPKSLPPPLPSPPIHWSGKTHFKCLLQSETLGEKERLDTEPVCSEGPA